MVATTHSKTHSHEVRFSYVSDIGKNASIIVFELLIESFYEINAGIFNFKSFTKMSYKVCE